jgi:hypothetical protein
MVEAGDVEDEIWMAGQSRINKLKWKNLVTFDLARHLTGKLKDNLKEWKCKVLKGDFDHKRSAGGWEKMDQETRRDCLKYLKKDVMGLRELRQKRNDVCIKSHHMSIYKHISTAAYSWNCWKREGLVTSINRKGFVVGSHVVELPNIEKNEAFRSAIKGGRTYLNKKSFVSKERDQFLNGEVSFEEISDYMIDADAVSLYPAAMLEEFPVGYCKKLADGEKKMRGKMGIYKCDVRTNKFLAHPVSGRRKSNGGLAWDLKDEKGVWLTSVEIEDMVKNGYKISILGGYYWEKTAKVLKSFIEKLFKAKQNAKKGSGKYIVAKLLLNSLYGKTIQKPIFGEYIPFRKNFEYWQIFSDYEISEVVEVRNSKDELVNYVAVCKSRDPLKILNKITKPSHYGAFILAYSRRIMFNFMREANKNFDLYKSDGSVEKQIWDDYAAGDTDSIQAHARQIHRIKKYQEDATELGLLSDDLYDEISGGKILRGIWIAPKLYALEYIVKKTGSKLHYHLRGKGLDGKKLKWTDFEAMLKGKALSNTRDFSIRGVGHNVPSTASCLSKFSLRHYEGEEDKRALTRVVNTKPWSGRAFSKCGGKSLPWGYAGITREAALSFLKNMLQMEDLKEGDILKKKKFKKIIYARLLRKLQNSSAGEIFVDAIWSLLKHETEEILAAPDAVAERVRTPYKQSLQNIFLSEEEIEEIEKAKEKQLAAKARERQRCMLVAA